MVGQNKLLRSYLRGIGRLSGAGAVSLFVPSPWSVSTRTLLIHEGPWEPLPEVADLTAAFEFQRALERLEGWSFPRNAEAWTPQELMSRAIASSGGAGLLVPVPTLYHALTAAPSADAPGLVELPRRRSAADLLEPDASLPAAWLALRTVAPGSGGSPGLLTPETESARWLVWILALGGAIASHEVHVSAVLSDPVSGLPGRAELQQSLAEMLERAERSRRPVTLALLNPDRFGDLNDHFGREAGDQVIQQIAARLRTNLRHSDLVARYGGVVFAVAFPDTSRAVAQFVTEKLLEIMVEEAYLDGAVRIGFSAGIGVYTPEDGPAELGELIREADRSLNLAKLAGGGRVVLWNDEGESEEAGTLDRLSGIFTGNLGNDYRNMVLLWETVSIIAASPDFGTLASEVVRRLYTAFRPERVAIFAVDESLGVHLVEGMSRDPAGERRPVIGLKGAEREVVERACREGEALASRLETPFERVELGHPAVAIPLTAHDVTTGCLYLDGPADGLELAATDLTFLKALAGQLAVALDRARLAEQERARRERDERRLRDELNELRSALRQSKLLYTSPKMAPVVDTVRRVAPTDATVLLIGESGTGKGVLARAIHSQSARRDKPLVEVDCGAIATTLIDSELFGREAGAYTGAGQKSQKGRLAEADGGTVLLDEVGELPLEVQSKLLRFVQEHQVIPVGATRPISVDVRILAATNRDLAEEVAAGRFRRDLYYRLNVVTLEVPPLRERGEDVLLLARHFVDQFAVQYQKDVRGITFEAEQVLLGHDWPGNVRELQNRILRAVILCEGELLGAGELDLKPREGAARREGPSRIPAAATAFERAPPPARPSAVRGGDGAGDPVAPLRERLAAEVARIAGGEARRLPLGRWLGEDLVLAAYREADGVLRRAAELLGLAESTFRRKSKQVLASEEAGLLGRPESWQEVRRHLAAWVAQGPADGDLLDEARRLLLAEVHPRFPGDVQKASAVMGVTPPTYRRWIREDGA